MKNKVGSNQYVLKPKKHPYANVLRLYFIIFIVAVYDMTVFLTPNVEASENTIGTTVSQTAVPAESMAEVDEVSTPPATHLPEPKPTELVEVVAEIAKTFEPEGKQVVVNAINCFYSESGLRPDAVGQNKDTHKSKDHGVAQLNDYWHKLSDEEKTDIKANIKRAYKIYKGRGDNFSAWYGKLCN